MKIFATDEINLNLVRILSGVADPSAGAGVARAIASLYTRASAGSVGLYQKTTAANTGWEKLAQSLAWKSVQDYGATGDGVTNDTAAVQQAITDVGALGGGVVWFPRGTYLITQLTINALTGVQLIGAGASSVLKWSFNAATVAGSMITVSGASRAIVFRSLRFDGSGLTNPAASRLNHLVAIGNGVSNVIETQIIDCTFGGMVAASGDGVHVVGNAGNLVSRLFVRSSLFDGCSRFGVGVEQGLQFGWILDNYFTNNETDLAVVATANVNTDSIQIQGNIMAHTGAVRHSVRLEGDATGLLTRLIFAENHVVGGFVTATNIQYGAIADNEVFSGVFASADPVLRIFGFFLDSLVSGNVIDRQVGSSAGTVITAEKATNAPTRFGIRSNVLLNEVATSGFLKFVDCTRFAASGNLCRSSDAGATTVMAIDLQAVTVALDDAAIGPGNQVSALAGTFLAAVRLLANGANVAGAVSVVSNMANQIDAGARFEIGGGGGVFTGNTILVGSNNWTATTTDFVNVGGAGVIPRIGYNAGTFGCQLFEGDGSPEAVVTARIGSMYLRRDGGQATAVYYKDSGTGNTGWVALGGSPLVFGTGDTTVAATAVYFAPGYITLSPVTEIQQPMTRPGTIRNLRVQVATAGTTVATVTFMVRKNGVDTTLTTTIGNTATGLVSDLTHSFTVVAGDLISVAITKSIPVATGQANVIASVELV